MCCVMIHPGTFLAMYEINITFLKNAVNMNHHVVGALLLGVFWGFFFEQKAERNHFRLSTTRKYYREKWFLTVNLIILG